MDITTMDIWVIFSSIITIATIIVRITPTKKDDAILSKIIKYIKPIASIFEKQK